MKNSYKILTSTLTVVFLLFVAFFSKTAMAITCPSGWTHINPEIVNSECVPIIYSCPTTREKLVTNIWGVNTCETISGYNPGIIDMKAVCGDSNAALNKEGKCVSQSEACGSGFKYNPQDQKCHVVCDTGWVSRDGDKTCVQDCPPGMKWDVTKCVNSTQSVVTESKPVDPAVPLGDTDATSKSVDTPSQTPHSELNSFWPLVQCGGTNQNGTKQPVCNFAEAAILVNRILNWFISMSGVVAAITFSIAGGKMLLNPENAGERADAMAMFQKTIVGLLIVLGAWLAIHTVVSTLVNKDTDALRFLDKIDSQ